LTTWRERAVLSAALKRAGTGLTALDLPCGAGRFWPAFEDAGVTSLIAGDISEGMLEVASANRLSETVPARLELMSAFDIDLPDNSVDFIACMRFLHHLSIAEDRLQTLSELRRVSSQYVAITLWVDGNLGAWRRSRKPPVEPRPGFGRRICRRRDDIEAEFRQAGFTIVDHFDVWPKLSMWRLYLLQCADA
jgi:SAM-dependent methyltransferase